MYEHDGCIGCKYVTNKENEYPCTKCKCNGFEEDMWTPTNDSVNHPNHYCQDGSIECIDEMIEMFGKEEVMSFCKLNVWKYRKRACFKNGEEDMKKSDWYMKKYIELKKEIVEELSNKLKHITVER